MLDAGIEITLDVIGEQADSFGLYTQTCSA
jgi:hypothetical protein